MASYRIPARANAGVAFAGVELTEAAPLIICAIVALLGSKMFGGFFFIVVLCGGFLTSKELVKFKKGRLDGMLTSYLYFYGLGGYSIPFNASNKRFLGDSRVINPAQNQFVDECVAHLVQHSLTKGTK
jgi:hypothetical protein